jgi:hypothetical protein
VLLSRKIDVRAVGELAASGYRVFAPVIPGEVDRLGLDAWLDGFIDGLGLSAVLLVVDPTLESFSRVYAAAAPERVREVTIIAAFEQH